jgi:hypothetical protein
MDDGTALGSLDCPADILMAVNGAPEILSGCCCAVTAALGAARISPRAASFVYLVIRERQDLSTSLLRRRHRPLLQHPAIAAE